MFKAMMRGVTCLGVLAFAVGCGGVDSVDGDDEVEVIGTTQEGLSSTTCKPTYVLYNTGLNFQGTSSMINYVGAATTKRIELQGNGYAPGYIDLAGFTVSGSWGAKGMYGRITTVEINGRVMTISGYVGTTYYGTGGTYTTSKLTFSGPVSFTINGVTGSNINKIVPSVSSTRSTGLTIGGTTSGYPYNMYTSLLCP